MQILQCFTFFSSYKPPLFYVFFLLSSIFQLQLSSSSAEAALDSFQFFMGHRSNYANYSLLVSFLIVMLVDVAAFYLLLYTYDVAAAALFARLVEYLNLTLQVFEFDRSSRGRFNFAICCLPLS